MADDAGSAGPPMGPDGLSAAANSLLREVMVRLGRGMEFADGLTEDERDGERGAVFEELADGRHAEPFLAPLGGVLALVGGAGALGCWAAGWPVLAVFLAAEGAFGALLGWMTARSWRLKRRLTVEDRLDVVAELARRRLITADEAASLRVRIDQLAHDRPGLRRP